MKDNTFTPKESHVDLQYGNLLRKIMETGANKEDRTGTGTKSIFGHEMRFNLQEGFPLLTTKKVNLRSIIYELLWFLRGETNIAFLKENNVSIWDEWADEHGELGPVYGSQWRKWQGADGKIYDQIANVVNMIKKNPDSRRLIVSAWKVEEIDQMKLPPCHCLFQFYVADGKISCKLYQRSCDTFLGVPFNIASYALLTMMVAQVTGYEYGDFVWSGGDVHIYRNHFEQVKLQLSRLGDVRPMPIMKMNTDVKDIFSFEFNDFQLVNYNPHPGIKAGISV